MLQYCTLTLFSETSKMKFKKGMYKCTIESISKTENNKVFTVKDKDCKSKTFEVLLRNSDCYITCTCKKYMKVGILCSHAFHVLNSIEVVSIPSSLITRRWLKDASPVYEDEDTTTTDSSGLVLNNIYSEVRTCIIMANNNPQKLETILKNLKKIKEEFTGHDTDEKTSKTQFFESVIGMDAPVEIKIKAPEVARTKGCGKRIKGTRELCIEKSKKQKRLCSYCKTMEFHDLRNCPKKKTEIFYDQATKTSKDPPNEDGDIETVQLSNN